MDELPSNKRPPPKIPTTSKVPGKKFFPEEDEKEQKPTIFSSLNPFKKPNSEPKGHKKSKSKHKKPKSKSKHKKKH